MPENTPEIKAFIRQNRALFWYTPEKEKENISHELLVEYLVTPPGDDEIWSFLVEKAIDIF